MFDCNKRETFIGTAKLDMALGSLICCILYILCYIRRVSLHDFCDKPVVTFVRFVQTLKQHDFYNDGGNDHHHSIDIYAVLLRAEYKSTVVTSAVFLRVLHHRISRVFHDNDHHRTDICVLL
jgi:hypothetical protein